MECNTKKSMEQMVYETLKNAILNRTLAPGTQLIESTISEKMKVSRTPIRNAIKDLALEGVVTIIPNRGAFIIQPSVEEIVQAFRMREELECTAIKFGLDKIEKDDIEKLNNIIEEEFKALRDRNIFEYLAMNKEFHMMLAIKSKNKYLIQFTEKIISQISIYLILYDSFYNNSMQFETIEEHKKMVKAIEIKDAKLLEALIRQHTENGLNDLKIDKIKYKSLNDIF
ncbi:putative HTH-type transcriptional regulator YdfH [Clostridium liquoris]|jgi:DNA-binding GntR family transcriptional regulator|uniref:Putative HTH-type transcriptional regulator YdfH n=1 Tax=Clostridium liquoris TaxID=1289519 RepID=A0A2T0B2L4_9CLOT|nr:GntR family transcriptional regulator [Clostridium liquoris]PRR78007.1 putative HTH-type transcriptional regulator YdfH [Clostridium liquoris]